MAEAPTQREVYGLAVSKGWHEQHAKAGHCVKVTGLQNLAAQLSAMSRGWYEHGRRHAREGRRAASLHCFGEATRLGALAAHVYRDARNGYARLYDRVVDT